MKYLLLASSVALLISCNPCKPGAQRCNGTVVEMCRPDKRWAKVQDCSKLHRTAGRKFDCAVRKLDTGEEKIFCRPQPTPATPTKDAGL